MKFLVFQHIAIEHPGIFRDFWDDAGVSWDAVELDEGEAIPSNLADYDALVAMGGPMNVWQEDEYPWLKTEKAAIRDWVVERRKPFLGICLGHQLLAEAIGGAVGSMENPEVGVVEVSLTSAAHGDAIVGNLPAAFDCFHWHGVEVKSLPAGAEIIVSNSHCAVQAFRWKTNAYGFQYHVELTDTTVSDWASIPAYEASLEKAMGPGAFPRLNRDVTAKLPEFKDAARQLDDGFQRLVRNMARQDA